LTAASDDSIAQLLLIQLPDAAPDVTVHDPKDLISFKMTETSSHMHENLFTSMTLKLTQVSP
jgi:hypothetical protein